MKNRALLAAITVVLAACSLVYELLIAETVSAHSGNIVVWYSVTIGIYLGALGLGAFVTKSAETGVDWIVALLVVELQLVAFGAAAPYCIGAGHLYALKLLWWQDLAGSAEFFFALAAAFAFLVGFLSGCELPLLINLWKKESGESGVGKILAADYAGALFGGLAFSLLIVPRMSMISGALLTGLLNALCAMLLTLFLVRFRAKLLVQISIFVLSCVLIRLLFSSDLLEMGLLNRFYYHEYYAELPLSPEKSFPAKASIERFRSPYQRIDLVRQIEVDDSRFFLSSFSSKFRDDKKFPRDWALYMNRDVQWFSNVAEYYHEYLAQVPLAKSGIRPRQVLILGGGDGLLAAELLKRDDVEQLTMVDIDPVILSLAEHHPLFRHMNRDVMHQARLKVVRADAFTFIREAPQRYDAVFIDLPYPADYNLSRLYSREFYSFIRAHLTESGIAAYHADGIERFGRDPRNGKWSIAPSNSWELHRETLRAAGFETIEPFFINLETNNREALRALHLSNRVHQHKKESWEEYIKRLEGIVGLFTENAHMGFILVSMKPLPTGLAGALPAQGLHVLNEERLKRAFGSPLPKATGPIDHSKVNSIMRPIWPQISPWQIRVPYSVTTARR